MLKTPPVVIGIVQINTAFSNQNYLPYVAGLLQAYTEKHAADSDRYTFLLPVYERQHVDTHVSHLAEANVVAFSTYVWNFRISLAVAQRLKVVDPDKLVIFGGPHVPDDPTGFFDEHPFVDVLVHGEGEQIFVDLLGAFPEKNWSDIPGISYQDEGGRLVTHPKAPRSRELDRIPSPYLEGTFDTLMAANPHEQWNFTWETNRGCPFSCTYCDWGSMTQSKVLTFNMERLEAEIDWMSEKEINYVYCCDANFGILARDIDLAKSIARNKMRYGYPRRLGVQNTKNATERAYKTQKILTEVGLITVVNLALQSVDAHTLDLIKRKNILLETYDELQRRFMREGISTFSDIILGLPGETYESFADGVSHVIKNGQHNRIQFNTLSILPNAEMGDSEYQAKHGMEIIETRVLNSHGIMDEFQDGVYETQKLVIATTTMPRDDWRCVRTFAWMTAFLHFSKVLQIPLLVVHREAGLSFRELIEAFIFVDANEYPLLGKIRDDFAERAALMQEGGPEYISSSEWLGMDWPIDEYTLIKLSVDGNLEQFYQEAGKLLIALSDGKVPTVLMGDAVRLNHALLKQPFHDSDHVIRMNYDLLPYYRAILAGCDHSLKEIPVAYLIERMDQVWTSWEDWMREVIWFGYKNGDYLYTSLSRETPCAADRIVFAPSHSDLTPSIQTSPS